MRKATIKKFVEELWGGDLYNEIKIDVHKSLRFNKARVAQVLDDNPNLNYTAIDHFRKMETVGI